jgi:DNA-binding transcriptional ArsR family regulator
MTATPNEFQKGSAPFFQHVLSDEQLQRIAKAIADPQRFAILACIAGAEEMPCKQLVAEFSITQATISHHLKELVAAELIHLRREGQLAILSCRRDVCEAYTQMLSQRLVEPGKFV